MIVYVDIDGTICDSTGGYENAQPRWDMIQKINNLYDEGHTIVYWTARGRATNVNHSNLTMQQLRNWDCKFTRLDTISKPSWDLLIDDKTKRIEEL